MEFVYVVPRRAVFGECYPHGFVPFAGADGAADGTTAGADRASFARALANDGFFVERPRAEREPDWKQVIPYTVIARARGGDIARARGEGDAREAFEVLLLTRSARGGDARLHHKLSIGIGGHVNPVDAVEPTTGARRDPVAAGSARELDEELTLRGATEPVPVGLINDDSNPVGAVHVGLVQVLVLPTDGEVAIREQDVLEGRLVGLDELDALVDAGANLESWSRLLVPHLASLLTAAARAPHHPNTPSDRNPENAGTSHVILPAAT